ncbi:MAG TPA: M20/M25/M40 family metallo-hydrolase [Gemmatimonadales bacterium]|nr:M20/M25/M40 family metallo-hydrolase [Gemmatimonadales bacterium]
MRRSALLSIVLGFSLPSGSVAQDVALTRLGDLITRFGQATAVTGYEQGFAQSLKAMLKGSVIDRSDNVILTLGSGSPKRLLACPMDEPGYVVGGIRDDGYLTLRRVGSVPGPLFDQQLEGQRVTIIGRRGEVAAVVAVRSVHLTRGRNTAENPFTVDEALVDVGAASRQEVEQLGIQILSPVTLTKRERWYGDDLVSGPAVGRRAACAAMLTAVAGTSPGAGTLVVALVAEQRLGATGLLAASRTLGPFDQVLVVDGQPDSLGRTLEPRPSRLPPSASMLEVTQLSLPARFADTPVETVSLADVAQIQQRVAQWIGGTESQDQLIAPASRTAPKAGRSALPPSLAVADTMLGTLVESYGASGAEDSVRETIKRLLPSWARPTVDTAGNLWLDLGKGDPVTVIVAHMDEIGFRVSAIRDDGTLDLTALGGFFPWLFEAEPALIHTARGPVSGVFLPRETVDSAPRRAPPAIRADPGVGSREKAEALGIAVGNTLTMPKQYVRLAGNRSTGRSFDDRVGCTALLLAVRRLDPARLKHRVIFVWSVREEIGLQGAQAVANSLGVSTSRVHAIDTFVSADSPLEPKSFGLAPLGKGPVARALDNSSVTPPAYVDSLVTLARGSGIPLQVGTTNGGNDGSTFSAWGVPDVAIGWPLRYSHSPAEVIDLRDVANLGALVRALAERW